MTYEKGKDSKEYIYDIFNPDGIFIGRTSLGNYGRLIEQAEIPLLTLTKKNRLYCLREKESGYKELAVYKMEWE